MSAFEVYGVPGPGAEDVLVGPPGPDEGALFTGTADGTIHRVAHDGRRVEAVAQTGGGPRGLELPPAGRVLVCDAHRGLLAVDVRTGAIEPLLLEVGGRPMRFCNN